MAETVEISAAQELNGKDSRPGGRLLTPEPTPSVGDGRIAADLARRVAELAGAPREATPATSVKKTEDQKHEIDRIILCSEESYADILAIDAESPQEHVLGAWRRLGCMVHPHYCELPKAKTAFLKLQKAAGCMGVDQPFIDEVNLWDGKEDLQTGDGSESHEDGDDERSMDVDQIPVPPPRVEAVYHEATPLIHKLGADPTNPALLHELRSLNLRIQEGNEAENAQLSNENDHIPSSQWSIPISFFGPHYQIVAAEYAILRSDQTDEAAKKRLLAEKELIDEIVQKHHFPMEWTVLGPKDFLARLVVDAGASATTADRAAGAVQNSVEYPWVTAETADGSVIVGLRQQGRWGTQVCVETVENGSIIRRLEPASNVGLLEVEKYKAMDGHKNLAYGQSQWSSKDRHDFDELLWVTKRQMQPGDTEAGNRNHDPPADCCVRFNNKGVQILTVTSLKKVLGRASARARIDKVCQRDGISPPWKAGWVSHCHDPVKVEKDLPQRTAMVDAQAGTRLSASEGEVHESRFQALETTIADLTSTVNTLANMLQEFMKSAASSS